MSSTLKIIILYTATIVFLMGCTATQRTTESSRTTVEQLLISEAINRSLPDRSLPIPIGSEIIVNTSGLTEDQTLLQQILIGWLGQQGYLVQAGKNNATYRVDVIVEALGTESGGTFFGVPAIQSQLIPFSLPELAIYKVQNQTGYVKFNMNIFERATGKFIGSTSSFLADSYHNNYTILFMFSYTSTDLTSPPQLNLSLRKPFSFSNKIDN